VKSHFLTSFGFSSMRVEKILRLQASFIKSQISLSAPYSISKLPSSICDLYFVQLHVLAGILIKQNERAIGVRAIFHSLIRYLGTGKHDYLPTSNDRANFLCKYFLHAS